MLLRHLVSSSFHLKEPLESQRQPSCLFALLEGLELPTRVTREGKQMTVDREGDEIQDERRNGLAGRGGEGAGVGVCSLQVDTPQVSG